jgi:hypothetical protein
MEAKTWIWILLILLAIVLSSWHQTYTMKNINECKVTQYECVIFTCGVIVEALDEANCIDDCFDIGTRCILESNKLFR